MSKRIYNEWTEEEIEELIDVYKDFGYKSYRFFKRHTVNSTKDMVNKLIEQGKLERHKTITYKIRRWTKEEKEYIKNNLHKSSLQISKELGRSNGSTSKFVKKYKDEIRNEKYGSDKDYLNFKSFVDRLGYTRTLLEELEEYEIEFFCYELKITEDKLKEYIKVLDEELNNVRWY